MFHMLSCFGLPPGTDIETFRREYLVFVDQMRRIDLVESTEPIGRRPLVRFVGHPDASANEAFLEEWAVRVAGWIDAGLEPAFFVHTASNFRTPEVDIEILRDRPRQGDIGVSTE